MIFHSSSLLSLLVFRLVSVCLNLLRLIVVIFSGFEVKEALRMQMEVQSKLHLQVEVCFILPWIFYINRAFSYLL